MLEAAQALTGISIKCVCHRQSWFLFGLSSSGIWWMFLYLCLLMLMEANSDPYNIESINYLCTYLLHLGFLILGAFYTLEYAVGFLEPTNSRALCERVCPGLYCHHTYTYFCYEVTLWVSLRSGFECKVWWWSYRDMGLVTLHLKFGVAQQPGRRGAYRQAYG